MRHPRLILCLLPLLLLSCKGENHCKTSIGLTNFSLEPNSAAYSGLNTVGGYEYLTGGNRGVVVVRTALNEFVAFDRTCPEDNTSQCSFSEGWGGTIMECPTCHTLFNLYANGTPLDGGKTTCNLYEYSTTYDGYKLYIY